MTTRDELLALLEQLRICREDLAAARAERDTAIRQLNDMLRQPVTDSPTHEKDHSK